MRPWIGISAVDLNPKIVAYYRLRVERGVLVTAVMRTSQAAIAGIQPGDIIVRLGAIDINSVRDLTKVMNAHDVGDAVDMDIVRGANDLAFRPRLRKRRAQLPPSQPTLNGVGSDGRRACNFLSSIGCDSRESSLTRES